jgi:hypothetical protein
MHISDDTMSSLLCAPLVMTQCRRCCVHHLRRHNVVANVYIISDDIAFREAFLATIFGDISDDNCRR